MDRITVVGIGPGSDGFLVPAAKDAIAGAKILAGAPRHLVPFNGSGKILLPMEGELDSFLDVLAEKRHCGKTVLLLSGDPCLFSLLGKITARFSPDEYEVIPGVSSFQLLFAKLGIQWNGTEIASLHGRPLEDACRFIRGDCRTLFFLDSKNTGPKVAKYLCGAGFPDREAVLAERLGYHDERIIRSSLSDLSRGSSSEGLALLLLEAGPLPPSALGVLPDEWFDRTPGVPLSKAACRALAVSLLYPLDGQTVLEVGAGSGGITVELARRAGKGIVYAVERLPEAAAVVERNIHRAGAGSSARIVEGEAPEALASLLEGFFPLECQQFGISRACTGEENDSFSSFHGSYRPCLYSCPRK
jgi:precorrin-6Y C5,15-methyltransferase (decarboxylating)